MAKATVIYRNYEYITALYIFVRLRTCRTHRCYCNTTCMNT